MSTFNRVFLVDSEQSSDLLKHPDYYIVAAFFVGSLFMSSIQYIIYSPVTAFAWSFFVRQVKSFTGRVSTADPEAHDAGSVREKDYNSLTTSSDGGLVLKRVPALTFTMFVLVAMAGAAQFASLLPFTLKNGEALCAFEIAWSSMSVQSARLIGLTIVGFSLRLLRITRWEGWGFVVYLLALTGMSLVTVVLGNGVLRPMTTSQPLQGVPEAFSCYRQHNFRISLATSILAMIVEGYCIFRCMYLLTPHSAQLLQSVQVISDIRVARGCSLFMLDAMLLLASSGSAGFYGEFVPVVIAGIIVMAAFNAPFNERHSTVYPRDKPQSGSPSLIEIGRPRSDSTFSLISTPRFAEADQFTVANTPLEGPTSARSHRTARGATDIEAQYSQTRANLRAFKLSASNAEPMQSPRLPPPTHTSERRVSMLVQAASTFISRPILPKATLVQRFEEQLRSNSTEFISANNDPRARFSYMPPSEVSRSGSRADGYSDDSHSVRYSSRRATVIGGSSDAGGLSRAPTTKVKRNPSAAVSVATTSDHGGRREMRNIGRHNTFGYKRSSYASTVRRTSVVTKRETLRTLPRRSVESSDPTTANVSRSTSATTSSSSIRAAHSHSSSLEPPELPSKSDRLPYSKERPPPVPQRMQSTDTNATVTATATASTSARDGGASRSASSSSSQSPAVTQSQSLQTTAANPSIVATLSRMSSAMVPSALTRTVTGLGQRLSRSGTGSSISTGVGSSEAGTGVSGSSLAHGYVATPGFLRRARIGPAAPSAFVQGRYVQVGGDAGETHTFTTSSTRASLLEPMEVRMDVHRASDPGPRAQQVGYPPTTPSVENGEKGQTTQVV